MEFGYWDVDSAWHSLVTPIEGSKASPPICRLFKRFGEDMGASTQRGNCLEFSKSVRSIPNKSNLEESERLTSGIEPNPPHAIRTVKKNEPRPARSVSDPMLQILKLKSSAAILHITAQSGPLAYKAATGTQSPDAIERLLTTAQVSPAPHRVYAFSSAVLSTYSLTHALAATQ